MGQFKFRIPEFWEIEPRHLKTIHVIGLDGVPKPCNVKRFEDVVVITRNQNESGKVYISFPFEEYGELTVCTGTLPESEEPYQLCRELARGTISRLRDQTSIWKEGGLEIPDTVCEQTLQAIRFLGESIVQAGSASERQAARALDRAMAAIFLLCKKFGAEIANYRVNESEIPSFWFAVPASASQVDETFDRYFDLISSESGESQLPSPLHRQILGPIFDASPMSKFSSHQADYQERRRLLLKRCDEEMARLNRRTALIHVACGLNGMGHRDLGYRQQVQLTLDVLEVFSQSQIQFPVCVSFDYPWAERLAWSVGGIHAMQIADELLRNGANVSYLGLEINLDYYPVGSLSRDPLQWIDLVDLWSQFGLPLILCVRVPQEANSDASTTQADSAVSEVGATTVPGSEIVSDRSTDVVANVVRDNLTGGQRIELLKTVLPMMIARPGVHGIVWRSRMDSDDLRFPNGGLRDDSGCFKPSFDLIRNVRKEFLNR